LVEEESFVTTPPLSTGVVAVPVSELSASALAVSEGLEEAPMGKFDTSNMTLCEYGEALTCDRDRRMPSSSLEELAIVNPFCVDIF
jgi:hypothetical protein